jgi:hypothetical protein
MWLRPRVAEHVFKLLGTSVGFSLSRYTPNALTLVCAQTLNRILVEEPIHVSVDVRRSPINRLMNVIDSLGGNLNFTMTRPAILQLPALVWLGRFSLRLGASRYGAGALVSPKSPQAQFFVDPTSGLSAFRKPRRGPKATAEKTPKADPKGK